MTFTWISLIIILFVFLIGLLLGYNLKMIKNKLSIGSFRSNYDVPNLLGNWECHWFDDSSDSIEPKVIDRVEIKKWLSKNEFIAVGHQPQYNVKYNLKGEVDPSRLVTLTYEAGKYPYESNRGVVLLEISRDGRIMKGKWFGRRSSGELGGGDVKCFKKVSAVH
jgi:hypothetical protein